MPMPNLRDAGSGRRSGTLLAFAVALAIVVVILVVVH
jgi:hypothetical protein